MIKYNDWQLSTNWSRGYWFVSSEAQSDVKDINLISDNEAKSCFFRRRRWLLKWNEYSPRKIMGQNAALSLWQPSMFTSMTDKSTRQHFREARPPPEKRRWQPFSSLALHGEACVSGRLTTFNVRTLEIWPCAVNNSETRPAERFAEKVLLRSPH